MLYQLNQHIIQVPDVDDNNSEQLNMDFFLHPEKRKIILGTVRFPNGTPAPNALVKISKLKKGCKDPENTAEAYDIGHAITNDSGEFIIGPVYPGDTIVLKISYIEEPEPEASITYISTQSPDDIE